MVLFEVQHLSVLVNTIDSEILVFLSKYVLCIIFGRAYINKIILGLPYDILLHPQIDLCGKCCFFGLT